MKKGKKGYRIVFPTPTTLNIIEHYAISRARGHVTAGDDVMSGVNAPSSDLTNSQLNGVTWARTPR